MIMRVTGALLALLLLLWRPAAADPGLSDKALAAIAGHGFGDDQVGFVVADLADGSLLAAHNADRPFIPASVAKVPTLIAALQILGPEWHFETRLFNGGRVVDGSLDGAVYLQGGGDPWFSSDQLQLLAQRLKAQGVQRARGLIYDASALPELPRLEPLQPEGAGYNPGLGALNLNFNRISAAWRRDGKGELQGKIQSLADHSRVPVDWIVLRPGLEGLGDFIHEAAGGREAWRLGPGTQAEGRAWLPVRQPGLHTALAFRRLAGELGIALPEPRPGAVPASAELVAVESGARLRAVVRAGLHYSNNLTAEAIGLAAARRLDPATRDLGGAGRVLANWVTTRLPETDWTGFTLANASGLSTASRASPRQVAAILRAVHQGGLADGDGPGLLAAKSLLTPQERRSGGEAGLEAKTGTMYFVSSIAGVTSDRRGRSLVVVVMLVDWARRAELDAAGRPPTVQAPPGSHPWLKRARALQLELIRQWAVEG